MIILEEDCGTTAGIWCTESKDSFLPSLQERIIWRLAAAKVVHHPDLGLNGNNDQKNNWGRICRGTRMRRAE
jgi:hypothetical protein